MHFPYVPSDIDAVVFDIGGVFTVRDGDLFRDGMARAGFTVAADQESFVRAHYDAVSALAEVLEEGTDVKEHEPDFWLHYERRFVRSIGVADDRVDDGVKALQTEVFAKGTGPFWRFLLDHNIAGFHRLIAAEIPVAIVSNNDGTAEQQMKDFGICQVGAGPLPSVSIIVDSGVLGVAKPDPAIFTPALAALGTSAARTLYVGDTVHADVRGAQNAGMPVVQLDPYGYHAHWSHARVADVTVLADLLLA